MKKFILLIVMSFMVGMVGSVQATVITDEDFESGASGWNDNSTESHGVFTSFLGRHGGSGGQQYLHKTYALSGNQTEVTINFDFYEIDSWDFERFNIFVDNWKVADDMYKHYYEEAPFGTTDLFGGASSPDTNYGFASYPDQGIGYSITVATTSTSLKLGFGTTLDQPVYDESWGIDNVYITSNDSGTPSVPEPATMILLATSLIGLGILKRRK